MDTRNPSEKLTERQMAAIPVILSCPSLSEGCRKAGLSRRTFYDWRKNEAFNEEWRRQSRELVETAFNALKGASGEAVEVLRRLLKNKNATIRLRAAQVVLEHTSRLVRDEEIIARLEALERNLIK